MQRGNLQCRRRQQDLPCEPNYHYETEKIGTVKSVFFQADSIFTLSLRRIL